MPRPRMCRRIGFRPNSDYFKPAGVRMLELEEIVLAFDEFEAMRLKDLLGMEQKEAARKMSISQPTFHRLVTAARKKIADAIVNSKAIRIEGGNVRMAGEKKEVSDMKVGVSVKGKGLETTVDELFGRCPFFAIAVIKDNKIESIDFAENISAEKSGGSGISAARIVAEKGVKAVISGNMGPRALDVFNQFNIDVFKARGTLEQALDDLIHGKLERIN